MLRSLRARRFREPRRPEQLTVSVVVPVKNAGPELTDLIVRMKEQKGFRAVEIVIVDSGSTDGSAETAEALGATVVRIAPEDFSHSYARNLGAERASGDYVLFTVQDALPSSDAWLHEMFSGLQRHEAAAVSCGEQPRPDSDLFYRVISWNHHRFMSVDGRRPGDGASGGRRSGEPAPQRAALGHRVPDRSRPVPRLPAPRRLRRGPRSRPPSHRRRVPARLPGRHPHHPFTQPARLLPPPALVRRAPGPLRHGAGLSGRTRRRGGGGERDRALLPRDRRAWSAAACRHCHLRGPRGRCAMP